MKKNYFKMILLLFAATACLALFTACTPSGEPPAGSSHTHNWGEWQTVTQSSCTENGEQERFCWCGERESEEIKALGHKYTYKSNGDGLNHTRACKNCEESEIQNCRYQKSWGQYFCDYCQEESIYSIKKIQFNKTLDGKDSYSIARNTGFSEVDFEIPAMFNGKPVVEVMGFEGKTIRSIKFAETIRYVREGCFYRCTNLEKVELNDGLEWIGFKAFEGCTALKEIVIPDTVTYIGTQAFEGSGLEKVTISAGLECIEERTFYQCESLKTIIFNGATSKIGTSAFYLCNALEELVIPDSVTTIETSAFASCKSLKKVTLPGALETLHGAFGMCTALEEVIIPESLSDTLTEVKSSVFYNTPWYNNQPDGLFYIGRVLCEYKGFAPEETFIDNIRPDTIAIVQNAFGRKDYKGQTGIVGVVIPRGVKKIGSMAFGFCSNLKSIILPDSVESVGSNLLTDCGATVYFEALTEPEGWSESSTRNTKFFGCELSEDGTYVVSFEKKADTFALGTSGTKDPVREGYTFGGWTRTQGNTTADYTSENVNRAPNGIILYAIWIKD